MIIRKRYKKRGKYTQCVDKIIMCDAMTTVRLSNCQEKDNLTKNFNDRK